MSLLSLHQDSKLVDVLPGYQAHMIEIGALVPALYSLLNNPQTLPACMAETAPSLNVFLWISATSGQAATADAMLDSGNSRTSDESDWCSVGQQSDLPCTSSSRASSQISISLIGGKMQPPIHSIRH